MTKLDQSFLKNTWRLLRSPLFMLLLMFFPTVMILPGCSTQSTGEDITLDIKECADALRETVAFQDTLTEISEEMVAIIYQIPTADVVQLQVYASTGATAEEIAVFEAVDDEAARKIETAAREHLAAQITGFKDYLPAELPKLEDPFISVKSKYVILCVSDHNEDAKKVLDTFLK